MASSNAFKKMSVINEGALKRQTRQIQKASANQLGQLTSLILRIEDFIEEDRIVESQSQSNGVSWLHLLFGNVKSWLVSLFWLTDDT